MSISNISLSEQQKKLLDLLDKLFNDDFVTVKFNDDDLLKFVDKLLNLAYFLKIPATSITKFIKKYDSLTTKKFVKNTNFSIEIDEIDDTINYLPFFFKNKYSYDLMSKTNLTTSLSNANKIENVDQNSAKTKVLKFNDSENTTVPGFDQNLYDELKCRSAFNVEMKKGAYFPFTSKPKIILIMNYVLIGLFALLALVLITMGTLWVLYLTDKIKVWGDKGYLLYTEIGLAITIYGCGTAVAVHWVVKKMLIFFPSKKSNKTPSDYFKYKISFSHFLCYAIFVLLILCMGVFSIKDSYADAFGNTRSKIYDNTIFFMFDIYHPTTLVTTLLLVCYIILYSISAAFIVIGIIIYVKNPKLDQNKVNSLYQEFKFSQSNGTKVEEPIKTTKKRN